MSPLTLALIFFIHIVIKICFTQKPVQCLQADGKKSPLNARLIAGPEISSRKQEAIKKQEYAIRIPTKYNDKPTKISDI